MPHNGPILSGCPQTESYPPGATNQDVDFSTCITGGDEPAHVPNTFTIQDPAAQNCPGSDSSSTWTATSSAVYDATKSPPFQYHLKFLFTNSATAAVTLAYVVQDVEGGAAGTKGGCIKFNVADILTANNVIAPPVSPPSAAAPPAASYVIPASSLGVTVLPATDTAATIVVPTDLTTIPSGITGLPPGAVQLASGASLTPRSLAAKCNVLIPGQCAADVFTYTPPTTDSTPVFLNCDVNLMLISSPTTACTGDTFYYYLLSGDHTVTSPTVGSYNIKVKAKTSFSRSKSSAVVNVFDQLGTTQSTGDSCASCHSGTANVWTLSNAADTYSSIQFLLAPGSAIGSTFYQAPCVTGATPIGMTAYPANSPVCTAIFNWINEGGYND